jgi:hypothetical protein
MILQTQLERLNGEERKKHVGKWNDERATGRIIKEIIIYGRRRNGEKALKKTEDPDREGTKKSYDCEHKLLEKMLKHK